MKTPKQTEREAKQLFRFCVVRGNVDESRVRLVARNLIQSNRRGRQLLFGRFQRLLEFEYARHMAEIESAVPLPPDLRSRVQTGLSAVYGTKLSWSFIDNPALIGGMRIKVGSDVYDGSVRSRIAALARSFGLTSGNGRRVEH